MVYKIRNKSFFYTLSGWNNNYYNSALNKPKNNNWRETYSFKDHDDRYIFIRAHQQYRFLYFLSHTSQDPVSPVFP